MDATKQQAITSCGRPGCGHPEDAHKFPRDVDPETVAAFEALGGPCTHFVASDASLLYQQYLGLSSLPPGPRRDGRVGKRLPICERCGNRHRGECLL